MTVLGFLDFGNSYMAETMARDRRHMIMGHMLTQAGPGHEVVGVVWKNRSGWERECFKAFPAGTPPEEIAAWKIEQGWPGHSGTRWNYFVDDARAWLVHYGLVERKR